MTGHYRWVIVAVGAFMSCIAIGAVFSLPVFVQPMVQATGWTRTDISAAMTLFFIMMGLTSFGWGMAMDRVGPRPVLLCGGLLLGLGLVLASRSSSVWQFQLRYGVLTGAGGGAIFAPLMATVTGWFDKYRSLAVSLVSAGMGVAPLTVAPTAARLVTAYDWRFAQIAIGIASWVLLLPAALLVRRSPALAATKRTVGASAQRKAQLATALKSPQFMALALTYFLCCCTHSGPLFHTVSYAMSCGLPVAAAVSIYSVEGLAGLAGRVGFGVLGDRFGAARILFIGLMIQACAVICYAFARDLTQFYSVAAVFGFTYAGVMPLYAVIARETFPLPIMGSVIGGLSMASYLGMSVGPLLGGLIYDRFATYVWLYYGSFGLGVMATLMILTYRPAVRSALEQA
jgi:MFS family permease